MPVTGCTGGCSEHQRIVKHPSLGPLPAGGGRAQVHSLAPDLALARLKDSSLPCLASSQSFPQWHAKHSSRLFL